MSSRFARAFPDGVDGDTLLIGATAQTDLSVFDPDRTRIVQRFAPDHAALSAQGWQVSTAVDGPPANIAVVIMPRARDEGRARLAAAIAHLQTSATLWVDGQKTDGIESMLRELRQLTTVDEVTSKAHGKIFRLPGPHDWVPSGWADHEVEAAPGFVTRSGVFSADGIDPGSAMLAAHLPARMPTRVVDLGAGWGWLSAQVLAHEGVTTLHLVEADAAALDCARRNISDPRAQFHWADATEFLLNEPVNGVVMNPPFHAGRKADPKIGAGFIRTAVRLLTKAGHLWMVANRHLPYEPALNENFARVEEIGGDARFKIIRATGAVSAHRSHPRR